MFVDPVMSWFVESFKSCFFILQHFDWLLYFSKYNFKAKNGAIR